MTCVLVLLSVGVHPASGGNRRAVRDARALELALSVPGLSELNAVHAGDPNAPALRDYLGMGLDRLTVLDLPAGNDPVPALINHARSISPDLILTGSQAESGEDSGMVPYLLAEALGLAVAREVTDLELAGDHALIKQSLPRGRRQQAYCPLPAVLGVSLSASPPRQPSFVRARAGEILVEQTMPSKDSFQDSCELRPYRKRTARKPSGGSARDRLKAATEIKTGEGRTLVHPTPDEAAREILAYLQAKGVAQ